MKFLFESLLKIIFFVILLPFKTIDLIARWFIAASFIISSKPTQEELIKVNSRWRDDDYQRKLFEQTYDYPKSAYWRRFRRHFYHKFILSFIVWLILIIRYTIL